MNGTILKRDLYPAMASAGIPRVGPTGERRTFHSFRHTFARAALEHAAELTWLSRHLGHSSTAVTDRCTATGRARRASAPWSGSRTRLRSEGHENGPSDSVDNPKDDAWTAVTAARKLEIALPGAFGVKQGRLERLIRLLNPLVALDEVADIHVDLSGLVSVSPAALALLTAALKRAEDLELISEESELIPPRSTPVRNYLLRMNLVRVMAGGEAFEEPFQRRETRGFRPCQHFTGAHDYAAVARDLTEALTERCVTDDIARASVRIALDEITENVVHHADTPMGGFAAAQGWARNQEFEIAIVDLGIGVRASLMKNPAYADTADDASAITRALQPRVSATPERNAGIGLFITKLLLEANGGLLLVRSGHGAVQAGVNDRAETESVALPGTLVALRARTDRPLDINSVYLHLEREHPSQHGDD